MPKVKQKTISVVDKQANTTNTFEDVFNDFINNMIKDDSEVDIITFTESSFYLNIKTLQPQQKFILKAFYNVPFDTENKVICIKSFPYDETGKFLTEAEYAQFLRNQKRCNFNDLDSVDEATELLLACGRRGGKTFISSIICAYEAYKLIIKDNPQAYYNMAEDEIIKIVNIASSGDQALELSTQIQNRIFNSEWFLPYIASYNMQELNLRTKHDLAKMKKETDRYGKPLKDRSTVLIESLLCSARSSRGGSVIVALFDELAHFIDNEGNRGGKTVYNSLTPSGATFGKDSKIVSLSSPYVKSGVFYELYTASFEDNTIKMLNMPTWEMNPRIEFSFLQKRYKKDPEAFWTEYGAQFSTTITGFFKFPEKIHDCIDVLEYKDSFDEEGQPKKIAIYRPETERMTGRYRYYACVDPAIDNNGYAFALVHCERDNLGRLIVVVDRWRKWSVNDPEFADFDFIDIEFIDNYILDLAKKFRIEQIVYDQFESAASIQKFIKMGLNAVKVHFSRQYNMKIYKNLRSIIYDKRLSLLYNYEGIQELVHLQEHKVGKKQFVVEAPKSGDVTTDDLADVLANSITVAIENEMDTSTAQIARTSVINTTGARSVSVSFGLKNQANSRISGVNGRSNMDRFILARKLGIYR